MQGGIFGVSQWRKSLRGIWGRSKFQAGFRAELGKMLMFRTKSLLSTSDPFLKVNLLKITKFAKFVLNSVTEFRVRLFSAEMSMRLEWPCYYLYGYPSCNEICRLEMIIEPNFYDSGSIRFGNCHSLASVRFYNSQSSCSAWFSSSHSSDLVRFGSR